MPIPIYEVLQRAEKNEVLWTDRPARNVTSAAARLSRKVKTEVFSMLGARSKAIVKLVRVTVIT